jgi:hypothetical protein
VEQTGTQTIAIFTGTLLKRELVGEQHIIQLVFQEGVERWLCLTSNRAHKNLDVGKQYHIEGAFRHLGSRPYIHEPVIATVTSHGRYRKVLLIGLVATLMLSGTVFALTVHHNQPQVLGASSTAQQQPTTPPAATQPTTTVVTAATTTPTVPAITPVTTKPVSSSKKKPVLAPVAASAPTPVIAQATPDPVVSVPPVVDPVVATPDTSLVPLQTSPSDPTLPVIPPTP